MIHFKRNMSSFDRVSKFIVAVLLLSLFFVAGVRGFLGLIFLVVGLLFSFSSITSYCPLYKTSKLPIDYDLKNIINNKTLKKHY